MAENGNGFNLGTAKATILLVAERFAAGAQVVQKSSLDAGKAVDGMAASFDRAKKAARDFDNTSLGKVYQNLKAIRDQLALVSAAAAGLGAVGIKAAQDFAVTRRSIELLTGSAAAANSVFAKTRALTDKFNVPFDDAIKGAQAFIPLAKSSGIAVDELVKSAIRFRAANPAKSFEEIKFSINEALSGDFTSIRDALDLSRTQRDQLKKLFDTQGPTAVLKELNSILEKRGLDDKTLEELGKSGANAFDQIKSEIKETMATAFAPLLKDFVLPTIKSFAEFLRNLRDTNPDLLKFGAGVTAIVAAGAPLLTFLTSAIGLYKAFTIAQAAASAGSTAATAAGALGGVAGGGGGRARDALGRFLPMGSAPADAAAQTAAEAPARSGGFSYVKAGLAAAGGVLVGSAVATGLAKAGVRSGDLGRIADGESALSVLGERLKQILVIVVNAFLDFGGVLAKGVLAIGRVIEQFVNVFRVGGTLVTEIFGTLRKTFGQFIEALGGIVAQIPGQQNAGQQIRNTGLNEQLAGGNDILQAQKDRAALVKELTLGFAPRQEDIDRVDANLKSLKDTVLGGLINILFPVQQAVQDTVQQVEDDWNTVQQIQGDSEEYLQQQRLDIAEATQKFNDDTKALETKRQQDIIELNKRYANEQVQIARERVKAESAALDKLVTDLKKLDTDLGRETEKEGRERQRKNLEMQIKFQRQEVEDAQAHADKLEQIRVDGQKKEQDALENFDFAALFDITEQVKQQTDQANSEYDKQRQERVQALQNERDDLVREYGAEREERLIKFEQDRADRQAAYEAERNKIISDTNEKLSLAQQAHANELTELANKYTQEQQLRQQAWQQELALLMQTEAQRAAILAQTQQQLIDQAYSFMNRRAPTMPSGGSGSTAPRTTPPPVVNTNPSGGAGSTATPRSGGFQDRMSGFAYGGYPDAGVPSVVNEPRPGYTAENIVRGMQSFRLPNGLGLFTPLQGGTKVEPQAAGGAPQVKVEVNLNSPIESGILTLEKAVAMIRQAVQEGTEASLSDFMAQYAR